MIIPGQFDVSATGAATYTIPIVVPPGTAGMVPALSLRYSSQSGDGIEGIGWILSGLPSITRCPSTVAQDDSHGSVNYSGSDKLCLDGQRLIYTGVGGTGYGRDGAIYHTEIESFSKIVEHNDINSTSSYFEVWTKSGQYMVFGDTPDSAVLTVGLGTNVIRAWAVNEITDTTHNYLTITYNCAVGSGCTDRTLNGEVYPVEIDYTGNLTAGVSPYNSVRFSYSGRYDTFPVYQAGASVTASVLLTDIKTCLTVAGTCTGSNLVSDYRLAYRSGSSVSHSRLTSITLCDNASHCLNPTSFGWQGGTGYEMLSPGASESVATGKVLVPTDLNNDGITDALPLPTSATLNPCVATYSAYSPPNYTTTAGSISNPITSLAYCWFLPGSQTILAPNGTSNILTIEQGYDPTPEDTYAIVQSPQPGSVQGSILTGYHGAPFSPVFPGDFNGDGIVDMHLLPAAGGASEYFYGLPGGGFSPYVSGPTYPLNTTIVTADFDGDGCVDRYILNTTATIDYSCSPAVPSAPAPLFSGYTPVFGDFNGDGKTDIMLVSATGAATLWLSTGTGFTEVNSSVASGSTGSSDWGKYVVYVGDWNGDGKADILLVAPGTTGSYGAGTTHKLYISTGTDFTPAVDSSGNPITIPNPTDGVTAVLADWNSDGATDIWLQGTNPNDLLYTFSYTPELMTSVSNGIGSTTVITYLPLNTNGSFYNRGTSAPFPYQNMDGPIYVVSRVDSSNGLGTCTSSGGANCYYSTYSYTAAQTNAQGRGFMGFATVAVKDAQTNITQTTTYSTTFPTAGMILSQIKTHTGNTHPLNSIANTYSTNGGCGSGVSPPAGVYQVCLTTNVTSGYDLNDTAQFPTITTNYTYDAYGNPLTIDVSVSDGSSKNTTNAYFNDATNWFLGRLQSTTVNSIVGSSNLTRQSSFAYSAATGLLTQESVAPGVSTCNLGSSPCELDTSYTYDSFGHRVTTTISGSGITTRTSYAFYDSLGRFQASDANALGQYEFWSYDPRFGSPISHTGPNNLTTNWSYDTFGRVTQEVRPDGTQTNTSYASCSGSCPTHGQFYSSSVLDGPGGAPQVGPQSYAYYDMLSRSIANDGQGFDGSNIRVATVYDVNGRVQETSRPYFTASASPAWTQFVYDDLGRVKTATFPDTSQTNYSYNGLTTTVINNLSQTTTTTKNAQGLVASVEDANSNTTSYAYDAFGDMVTITDPLGNVVSNTFDIRGNKVVSNDPDMGTWTYSYDVLSELTSQTDAKSQTTTLTYDILGRPLTRTEPSLYSAWTYGASAANHNIGKIIGAETCPTSACSTYISNKTSLFDSYGRESQYTLETPSDYFGYGTMYNSSNGLIASITYPSGYTVNRTYNSTGFLTQLSDSSAPVWTINARDAELHITSQTSGNNVTTTQAFNPNTGLIVTQQAGAGGAVANFSYAFDTIGNLTSRSDANESYSEYFCYDSLNRLTNYNLGSACTGGTTVSYNAIGSIISKSDTGGYSYNGSGPHAVSSITGTVDGLTNPNYSYDPNGNLTCVSSGSGCSGTIGRSVNLTSFNMAASIDQGANSLSLTYDDQHQRLQQANTVSGTTTTTTVYLNDAASGAMSQRVTVAGTTPTDWGSFNWGGSPWGGTTANALPTWTDYITIDGQIVAQRSVQYPIASAWGFQNWGSFNWGAPTGNTWGSFNWGAANWSGNVVSCAYFNLDHLGSVSVITDQGGNVIQRLSFDPWGKQRNPNGTSAACGTVSAPTTRGYTNQEEMPTQCLVNLNARLYDASIGKFMAPDPVVGDPLMPNAFNRYAYVLNNPLSFTDPSGLCFLGCFWTSPIFSAALDITLVVVGLPELEAAADITTPTATGVSAAFAAASQSGITLTVNGAIAGAASAGVSGGNVLKGAAIGGLSAGLGYGVGQLGVGTAIGGALGGSAVANDVGDFVAQGAVGGIVSIAQGSNFGSGFLAGGFSSLTGPLGLAPGSQFSPEGLIESASLGGFGSILGGGKFANGAVTGAFAYAASASYSGDDDPQSAGGPRSQGGTYGAVVQGIAGPFSYTMWPSCNGASCAPDIQLQYNGSAGNLDWLQTYSATSVAPGENGTWKVDNGGANTVFYPSAWASGPNFEDWPGWTGARSFQAQTSVVTQGANGAYSILGTVKWGFTFTPGSGVNGINFSTPTVTTASPQQQGIIRSLNGGH